MRNIKKDMINVPIEDKADAHLGYEAVSSADICPNCRKIYCECGSLPASN